MPDHEDTTANALTIGGKGHPLGEPLGKIVHSIQNGGIDGFKFRLVCVADCIRGPKSLRLSIIESFVENSMGWRKGLHCEMSCEQSKWREPVRPLTHPMLGRGAMLDSPSRRTRMESW